MRLVIAAVALLLGGVPPTLYFLPIPVFYGLITFGLKVAWIISGLASGYLLYRWITGGQKIFGGNYMKDRAAFFMGVVSGINLGLVGLLNQNIGLAISSNYAVFVIIAAVYVWAAYHLYMGWKKLGEKVF